MFYDHGTYNQKIISTRFYFKNAYEANLQMHQEKIEINIFEFSLQIIEFEKENQQIVKNFAGSHAIRIHTCLL